MLINVKFISIVTNSNPITQETYRLQLTLMSTVDVGCMFLGKIKCTGLLESIGYTTVC